MVRQVAHSEKKNEKETQDKKFIRLLKFKEHFQSRVMDRKETADCL